GGAARGLRPGGAGSQPGGGVHGDAQGRRRRARAGGVQRAHHAAGGGHAAGAAQGRPGEQAHAPRGDGGGRRRGAQPPHRRAAGRGRAVSRARRLVTTAVASSFFPIPMYTTVPNEGSTYGIMPVFLSAAETGDVKSILAPSLSWNSAAGVNTTFR